MLIKVGHILVSQEKSYMSTCDDVAERFPVKIAFARKLTEDEMIQLAGFALVLERGDVLIKEEKKND